MMKKAFVFICLASFAALSFAKDAVMLRSGGILRTDKGNGGVEWAASVPAGAVLSVESDKPVPLTMITTDKKYDNIMFYKVSYEGKKYYARESEIAFGKIAVITEDTTLFATTKLSSFINAQLEAGTVVVANENSHPAYNFSFEDELNLIDVKYYSENSGKVVMRYVFATKVSSDKDDIKAVLMVDKALALKDRAQKKELFKNAAKLTSGKEFSDYVAKSYDSVFGSVKAANMVDLSGKVKTPDGSNVNLREEPVDGKVVTQLSNGDEIYYSGNLWIVEVSREQSTFDNITAPWYCLENSNGDRCWIFGGYVELDVPIQLEKNEKK